MELKKIIEGSVKSKTMRTAAIVAALGVAEANLGLIREQLGDYYGYTYLAIAIVFAFLRVKTTESLGAK